MNTTLNTTTVAAEAAPISVQLWPTRSPEFASAYTLAEVLIHRTAVGTWVEWVYQNGNTRNFKLGEQVACSF
jgi:hypothetical protein